MYSIRDYNSPLGIIVFIRWRLWIDWYICGKISCATLSSESQFYKNSGQCTWHMFCCYLFCCGYDGLGNVTYEIPNAILVGFSLFTILSHVNPIWLDVLMFTWVWTLWIIVTGFNRNMCARENNSVELSFLMSNLGCQFFEYKGWDIVTVY